MDFFAVLRVAFFVALRAVFFADFRAVFFVDEREAFFVVLRAVRRVAIGVAYDANAVADPTTALWWYCCSSLVQTQERGVDNSQAIFQSFIKC